MANNDSLKGILHRFPLLQNGSFGKLGPGFGYGVGCGVGLGAGIIGGSGLGVGFPGFQFGVGLGAGCGIGVGFGYGLGKGRAYDENGKHSNVGKLSIKREVSTTGAEIGVVFDDLISVLKRALESFEKESAKWRR
eukprot:c21991_g1_i1 orf=595-999(-)